MQLPDDSIGISDILGYRECPRRMSYGMRRHSGKGAQDDTRTPEGSNQGAQYGSAIHEAIAAVEEGYPHEKAIQIAWDKYGRKLRPSDLALLNEDLITYHARDFPNTRTISSEEDLRVPLLVHDGRQVYFRFKLDRLYERVDAPGTYIHVDYKSSRWARSEQEVHEDLQMWAYNFAIHEYFPECERLIQVYDQLRYGQFQTRKNDVQRAQMRNWLEINVRAILDDEDVRDDGLLRPSFNKWCPWCPVMESCDVVGQLTDYAATRIDALAPTVKEGRRKVTKVEPGKLEEYTAEFDKVRTAIAVLERFQSTVKDELLRELPDEELAALGYELAERSNTVFEPDAVERLYEALGPEFFSVAKITKSKLEAALKEDPDLLEWALEQGTKVAGTAVLQRMKEND